MEGHGARGVRILGVGAVNIDESLEGLDGLVGGHAVRDKELAPTRRLLQVIPEAGLQDGIQGKRPDEAALAFDGDGLLPKGLGGGGGVDAEALVDLSLIHI